MRGFSSQKVRLMFGYKQVLSNSCFPDDIAIRTLLALSPTQVKRIFLSLSLFTSSGLGVWVGRAKGIPTRFPARCGVLFCQLAVVAPSADKGGFRVFFLTLPSKNLSFQCLKIRDLSILNDDFFFHGE